MKARIFSSLIIFSFTAINAQDLASILDKKSLINEMYSESILEPDTYGKNNISNSENSVIPEEYYIGGGDVLAVSIIGLPSIRYTVTINQAGDFYIPELGLLPLGKITLADSYTKIAAFIREKAKKDYEVYIQFIKAKNALITVSGAIENPGTYVLSGTERVLDAIIKANNGKLPSLNEFNYREIMRISAGQTQNIDMFDFLYKSQTSGNPYLFPGEHISISLATRKILLNADSKTGIQGWVPIKEKETLSDFLSFHKMNGSVDTTKVIVQKIGLKGERIIQEGTWEQTKNILLQDRDIVTIPQKKNYSTVYFASIDGEVASPGKFSIIREKTTVEEIIKNAGGLNSQGDINRAVVFRNKKHIQNRSNEPQSRLFDVKEIRPEMMSGMEKMVMVQDFSMLKISSFGTSLKLLEDDRIYIPRKDPFVYISGCVKNPGAYSYKAGAHRNHYIRAAGGFTNKASKSNIFGIRYYDAVYHQTEAEEIVEGDIIVVPGSVQGKTLTTIILPVISIVLSTIGTIVTIITISSK